MTHNEKVIEIVTKVLEEIAGMKVDKIPLERALEERKKRAKKRSEYLLKDYLADDKSIVRNKIG